MGSLEKLVGGFKVIALIVAAIIAVTVFYPVIGLAIAAGAVSSVLVAWIGFRRSNATETPKDPS